MLEIAHPGAQRRARDPQRKARGQGTHRQGAEDYRDERYLDQGPAEERQGDGRGILDGKHDDDDTKRGRKERGGQPRSQAKNRLGLGGDELNTWGRLAPIALCQDGGQPGAEHEDRRGM